MRCDGRSWVTRPFSYQKYAWVLTLFMFCSRGAALTCDFETDTLCGWNQDTDDNFDWQRGQGPTRLRQAGHNNTGIAVDHTFQSADGWFIHADMSGPAVGDKARILTQTLPSSANGVTVNFWYHMYNANQSSSNTSHAYLNVVIRDENDTDTMVWTRDTATSYDDWVPAEVVLPLLQHGCKIIFEAVKSEYDDIDVGLDDVTILPTYIDTTSQGVTVSECNFEYGFCDFSQDKQDDFDWLLNKGSTLTGATGPEHDHTYGESWEGTYAYAEASTPQREGDRARLLSPVYSINDGEEEYFTVTFYNHMHGFYMGRMNVYVHDVINGTEELIWSKEGKEKFTFGDHWLLVELDINVTGSFQVVFEGVVGSDIFSDMAIDDVRISRKIYQSPETATTEAMTSLITPLFTLTTGEDAGPDSASSSEEMATNRQQSSETSTTSSMLTPENSDVSTVEDVHQSVLTEVMSSEPMTTNQQSSTEIWTSSMRTTENSDVSTFDDVHKSMFSGDMLRDQRTNNQQFSTEGMAPSSTTQNAENSDVITDSGIHRSEFTSDSSFTGTTINHRTSTGGLKSSSTSFPTNEKRNITTDDVLVSTSESTSKTPSPGTLWPDTAPPHTASGLATSQQNETDTFKITTSASVNTFTDQKTLATTAQKQEQTWRTENPTNILDGVSLVGNRTRLIIIACVVFGSLVAFCVILTIVILTVRRCKYKKGRQSVNRDCETNQQQGVDNIAFSDNHMIEETFPPKNGSTQNKGKIQLTRLDAKN